MHLSVPGINWKVGTWINMPYLDHRVPGKSSEFASYAVLIKQWSGTELFIKEVG